MEAICSVRLHRTLKQVERTCELCPAPACSDHNDPACFGDNNGNHDDVNADNDDVETGGAHL